MKNAVSFLIVVVFLLIVYMYTTGKIEKRRNRKEAKHAGRFPVKAEDPDEFLYCRVAVLPCNAVLRSSTDDQMVSDMEMRMAGRINRVIRDLEDTGGHDFSMDSFIYQDVVGTAFLIVIIRCIRPHIKDEG